MNQIASAAERALATCPTTSWIPQPVYDHGDQRLAFDTMKRQLLDDAAAARARVFVMLVHWASTGTWPKFRNAPVFFLRQVLYWGAGKKGYASDADFPTASPPWEPKHVAHFLDRSALDWYSIQSDAWARDLASEFFDAQENLFDHLHPFE